MPVPCPYRQLALNVPATAEARLPGAALSALQAALAAGDRAILAAHLAGVARSRGRVPVPKSGTARPARAGRRIVPRPVDVGAVAAFRSHVRLTSVDLEANRFRSYALSWRPTLWGDFALVQTWGRLGSPSRSCTTFFASRPMAQEAIVRLLRRRMRHGYRVVAWD
jgi:predicted DNA-binding WGR domain protein